MLVETEVTEGPFLWLQGRLTIMEPRKRHLRWLRYVNIETILCCSALAGDFQGSGGPVPSTTGVAGQHVTNKELGIFCRQTEPPLAPLLALPTFSYLPFDYDAMQTIRKCNSLPAMRFHVPPTQTDWMSKRPVNLIPALEKAGITDLLPLEFAEWIARRVITHFLLDTE